MTLKEAKNMYEIALKASIEGKPVYGQNAVITAAILTGVATSRANKKARKN